MGWRIYRIWSTDWIKNQEKESKKLLSAIQNAIENSYDEKKKSDDVSDKENSLNYISITQKDEIDKENPYELDIYKEYYLNTNNMHIPIEKLLDDVINLEYPIHFDEICRRISLYYSAASATKKVKELVFRDLCRVKYKYDIDDNFYMPKNAVIRPRCNLAYNNQYMRGPYSLYGQQYYPLDRDKKIIKYKRPIKKIYIKELALIMKRIEEKSINIDTISLFEETAKVLNTRYITHFDIFEKAYNLMKLL